MLKCINTSFLNNFDTIVVTITELAVAGSQKYRFIQMIHDHTKCELGHFDFVDVCVVEDEEVVDCVQTDIKHQHLPK